MIKLVNKTKGTIDLIKNFTSALEPIPLPECCSIPAVTMDASKNILKHTEHQFTRRIALRDIHITQASYCSHTSGVMSW